jgi:hypothetical protein
MKKVGIIIALIFVPALAILPLLSSGYFNMHDIQHPVRLFLLNKGISQGYLYPRWVDDLGFGFGYPLFNFYPPLIYYIAEFFVRLGFSIIDSIKLMLIFGFILGGFSSYLYARLYFSRRYSLLVSIFFTYTFYHAITIYVRGAFAEFFSYSLFPLVAYFLHKIINKPSLLRIMGLGVSFAFLLLCHPLIAFPSIFFVGAYFLLTIFFSKNWFKTWISQLAGLILGLGLSAFFWLPSLLEKKYTLVEDILTRELYNYQLHFVKLKQLYYSPWGFGGSTAGVEDGFSYQVGKYYLLFLAISIVSGIILSLKRPKFKIRKTLLLVGFNLGLLIFSYFMSLPYSQFIWDRVKYLWYLQFPWRFFTFANFYLSVVGVSVFLWLDSIIKNKFWRKISQSFLLFMVLVLVYKYHLLFRPQTTYQTTDQQLTNLRQRQWLISKTSFEFVPKGVTTKKNELGVTTLAIDEKDLPKKSFKIVRGKATVKGQKNNFQEKQYLVNAKTKTVFQLNTYYFPGWQAFINKKPLLISNNNSMRLIRVTLPKGKHLLNFSFKQTLVRKFADHLSLLSFAVLTISMAVALRRKPQRLS